MEKFIIHLFVELKFIASLIKNIIFHLHFRQLIIIEFNFLLILIIFKISTLEFLLKLFNLISFIFITFFYFLYYI